MCNLLVRRRRRRMYAASLTAAPPSTPAEMYPLARLPPVYSPPTYQEAMASAADGVVLRAPVLQSTARRPDSPDRFAVDETESGYARPRHLFNISPSPLSEPVPDTGYLSMRLETPPSTSYSELGARPKRLFCD